MTVRELIDYLNQFDGDLEVCLDDNVDKPEEGTEYIDLATIFWGWR